MDLTGNLKGAAEMQRKIRQIAEKYPKHVGGAMYEEAQIEMTEAKRRCPVSLHGGTLRASGTVHPPEWHGNDISVALTFGGPAIDYAIAVHEHLSEHSPPSWIAAEEGGFGVTWRVEGTGPKFLEGPLNESTPHMARRIGRRAHLNSLRIL